MAIDTARTAAYATYSPPVGGSNVQPANLSTILAAQMREAAQAVAQEFGVDSLLGRLATYPKQIRGHQVAVHAARQAVAEAENDLLAARASLVAMVAAEINPATGKPAFSNAEAREAELIRRQEDNPVYQDAVSRLRDAQQTHAQAQAELDMLQNEFAATRKAADLVAGQLHLLASH